MKEALPKSSQMISMDSLNVISSPELAAGLLPSSLQDGPPKDLFGQPLSPASPSQPQASLKAWKMSATYGPSSLISSRSAVLTSSLANKLRVRLDLIGSMEYRQTWKERVTPLGRQFSEHTASARRTSDNDFTGWASPTAMDGNRGGLEARAHDTGQPLSQQAALATPWALRLRMDQLPRQAQLAAWSTCKSSDGEKSSRTEGHESGNNRYMANIKRLAGWHAPDTASDAPNMGTNCKNVIAGLGNQARGVIATSSTAETTNSGALRPGHRSEEH